MTKNGTRLQGFSPRFWDHTTRYQQAWAVAAAGFLGADLGQVGLRPVLVPVVIFTLLLLRLSMIDLEQYRLPDRLTKPGIGLGLCFSTLYWVFPAAALTTPEQAVVGLLAGYGGLWLVVTAYYYVTGRYGMGGGDLKLLGMIGAWLGWQAVAMTITIAALSGAVVAVVYLLRGKGRDFAIPFGPYLALGGWLMVLWPHAILHGYLHLLGG